MPTAFLEDTRHFNLPNAAFRATNLNMSLLSRNEANQSGDVCPYSNPPFENLTDDHIFPDFLGGRRFIRVCRDCNSRFGHSFEAKVATRLRKMQVFVSHFGLDLTYSLATWPSALEIDGTMYDLKSGPDGVQYELAHPVIFRNEGGKVIGGRARSRAEAQKAAASLIKKGKAKEIKIEAASGETFEDIQLTVDLSYDDDLYKFSAKLACNTAVLMGRRGVVQKSGIAGYLHGTVGWGAGIGHCDTSGIRHLRPPLSHTVYIEFGPQSHAVVILFGGMQIYVPLPAAEPGLFSAFSILLRAKSSSGRSNH